MSRTYRLRHLPQPEGGRSARRFVDGRLRFPADCAEEDFYSHLAHVELKLPCLLKGGPNARTTGWRNTHERCLPRDTRDWLWSLRPGGFWRLGWTRTVTKLAHPHVGYGLAVVPSATKRWARNQVYRYARRRAKRLLRTVEWVKVWTQAPCPCGEPFCDLGAVSFAWVSGTDLDPDEMNFDDEYSVKAGLARSAWLLTW
jgi:hypothetical protein